MIMNSVQSKSLRKDTKQEHSMRKHGPLQKLYNYKLKFKRKNNENQTLKVIISRYSLQVSYCRIHCPSVAHLTRCLLGYGCVEHCNERLVPTNLLILIGIMSGITSTGSHST